MEKDNRCTIPFEGSHVLKLHIGTVSPCCKIQAKPFTDTILTKNLIELRQAVINNERHPDCIHYWKQEDKSELSYRQLNSKHFEDPETWTWDTLDPHQPATNVTLIFSNKCQLMCAYCDPSVSSMWEDTGTRFIKFKGTFTSQHKLHNTDRLKELINISELRTLIISGGEPMLGKDCVQFLQELSPSTFRTILIITNLSYGNETMNTLLSILNRHSNTSIAASLDALGDNISRKYLNWELWKRNFEFLVHNMVERKKINTNIHIVVIMTVSILNYANIQSVIEYIISFRKQGITDIRFNINPLREGTLCSLPSSELDLTKCVNLSESDMTYLTSREISMVWNFNALIRNNKRNAMLEKDTKEFLLEYMK